MSSPKVVPRLLLLRALSACAPLASMPALLRAEPGHPYEVGAALTYASSHPVEVSDPPPCEPGMFSLCLGLPDVTANLQRTATGQAWFLRRGQGSFDIGAVAFANKLMGGTGAVLRWRVVDNDVFRLGFQTTVGWLWMAVAMPMSVNLADQVAVYATPSIGA